MRGERARKSEAVNGVSSIRVKQGLFLIFFLKVGFGRENVCQVESFDLAGRVLDLSLDVALGSVALGSVPNNRH